MKATRVRRRRAFTLMELLVVIFIIILISVVALPVVLPAYNHREVSGAGRVLQGALVGAQSRATAIDRPAGIRLLPDPTFAITWNPTTGQINPYTILAYNRAIPIESAPDYNEGYCTPVSPGTIAYLGSVGEAFTPPTQGPGSTGLGLMLVENLVNPRTGAPNPPTSWFWNIRVGDRIQLNNSGNWYTVVGPLVVWPGASTPANQGNSELFVNVGPPGPAGGYGAAMPTISGQPVEFLMLVNGVDDNRDGWVDPGFDNVDNNGNGSMDMYDASEWEMEAWLGSTATHTAADVPYTIRRRPAPTVAAREVALPSSMVVDATTSFLTRERSRLPVNPYSGYVDIIINPDGTVVPSVVYSSPASFGMDSAFFHFWLAERQDLVDVQQGANGPIPRGSASAPYYLPIANPGVGENSAALPGPYLKGEYSVLSLATRSGNITVSQSPPFLFDAGTQANGGLGYNAQRGTWNASNPFIQAEQGAGGTQ